VRGAGCNLGKDLKITDQRMRKDSIRRTGEGGRKVFEEYNEGMTCKEIEA